MVKKKDRLTWLIVNQDKWQNIANGYPHNNWVKIIELRTFINLMISDGLYKPQGMSTLEMPVLTLIKECRRILPGPK